MAQGEIRALKDKIEVLEGRISGLEDDLWTLIDILRVVQGESGMVGSPYVTRMVYSGLIKGRATGEGEEE